MKKWIVDLLVRKLGIWIFGFSFCEWERLSESGRSLDREVGRVRRLERQGGLSTANAFLILIIVAYNLYHL